MKNNAKAEKIDHRKLGELLDLFSFHDIAPAMPFWHPKGMIIINELRNYIRKLQKEMGYLETATPLLVKKELYKISGHWEHYQENIFPLDIKIPNRSDSDIKIPNRSDSDIKIPNRNDSDIEIPNRNDSDIENETFALKPMSCPETVYIYSSKIRSYKDLPLRFSEFGYLHRKEKTGVLTGLFRVYGFIQDDAHIFCRPDQLFNEINGVLKLITKIHKTFNLKTFFALATRPKKAMGSLKLWEKAENSLEFALKKNKLKYETRPKDGAFYGPKIDVDVEDSLGRKWTVATIQLDFQMPEKFNLFYIDQKGGKQRPVIIHRSSIGSFERFIGILLEHYNGAFPLWLAPEQIWIIPISAKHKKYAQEINKKFQISGFRFQMKDENETISKKIREGEIQRIPYLLIVGDKEMKTKSVRVRSKNKDLGSMKLNRFISYLQRILNSS